MLFSFQLPITPIERSINLANWIKRLTEARYISVDKGHRSFKWADEGIENSEIIGFNRIVHHYKPTTLSENKVVLNSKNSKIYIFHLIPIRTEISWIMNVSDKSDFFRCSVEVMIYN
jgi:hypothetical protein